MRPIRVLVGMLGLDPREEGAGSLARALRDGGMEVLYLGCGNLPPDIVKAAVEEGVEVIALSCDSGEHLRQIAPLLSLLGEQGLSAPVVVGGSAVTPEEARAFRARGVAAAFGPAADLSQVVATVARLARGR